MIGITLNKYQDEEILSPFDPNIAFFYIKPDSDTCKYPNLLKEELAAYHQISSPKRKQEFKLGRMAAKMALAQIGYTNPPPVLRGLSGEPVWPDSVSGSIAHSQGLAIAAVSYKSVSKGIGLDIESIEKKRDLKIFDRILTLEERTYVHDESILEEEKELRALTIFCAKEACFKAFFGATGKKLRFKDASFRPNINQNQMTGLLMTDTGIPEFNTGFSFKCTITKSKSFIIAGVAL